MHRLNESDWKLLKRLKPIALERFCERILRDIQQVPVSDSTFHERYLRMWSDVQKANDAMARAFDDVRRSNAVEHLAAMRQETLITDSEFAGFSPDTRDSVNALQVALGRRRK